MRGRKIPVNNDTSSVERNGEDGASSAPLTGEAVESTQAASAGPQASQGSAETQRLQTELEAQQRLTAEKQDLYLRALADLENIRRRARLDQEDARKFGTQALILKLLPVLDNFERALSAASGTDNSGSLVDGVSLILRQFQDALKSEGVEPIDAVGKPFDPQFHEAVAQVPATPEHPDNTVVQEAQRGYTLNGRVIRPSMVQVAMG
ncbi:MAG TPA: nucleotide exchange factor GrpE [Armatimonadota bacterium]|jgi:molecular chaperone GrpE